MSVIKFRPPATDPVGFLAQIETLEVFRVAKTAADTAQTKRRHALAKLIVDAEAKHAASAGLLARRVKATQQALDAARAALAAAQADASAAHHAQYGASLELLSARNHAEGELRCDADVAAINSFMSWTLDELERTRKKYSFNAVQVRHPITGHATVQSTSNKASVEARVQAIRAARDAAELLLLEPDQTLVRPRLATLADSLPPVEDVK